MKKLIIGCVAAILASASVYAVEGDEGFYAGAFGGANWHQQTKKSAVVPVEVIVDGIPTIEYVDVTAKNHLRTGFVGGLFAGYKFGCCSGYLNHVRVEAEVAYRRNNLKSISVDVSPIDADLVSFSDSFDFDAKGHVETTTVLANVLYDFDNCSDWTPYVGFGLGYGHVKEKIEILDVSASRTINAFAWQAIAGVSYRVACNTDVGVEYRFLDVCKSKNDNAVLLSVKRYF